MRIKEEPYSTNSFIFNTFSVSLFSSFYNLLCSLTILKDDIFYGKSVIWDSFMIEHKIRIGFSMMVSVASMVLLYFDRERMAIMIVLFVFYIILLILNINILAANKFS